MKRREIVLLAVGLAMGLLAGIGLVAVSDRLRDTRGTAADSPGDDDQDGLTNVEFYLADIPSTREWLMTQSPDDSEQIAMALETLMALPHSPQFSQDFQAARDDLNLVLPRLYADLSVPLAAAEDKDKAKLSACLGMDDNPYSAAPTLYFYLTIPRFETQSLELPAQWNKLDKPQSNTLFWQLLDCYPSPESSSSGS